MGNLGFGSTGATSPPDGQKRYAWNEFEPGGLSLIPGALTYNGYPENLLISDFDSGQSANNLAGSLGLGSLEGISARGDSGSAVFTFQSVPLITAVTSGGVGGLPTDNGASGVGSFGDVAFDTRVATTLNRKFIDLLVNHGALYGDTNNSGGIDVDDINELFLAIAFGGSPTALLDLNDDSLLTFSDVDILVNDLIQTEFGDIDLDGDIDSADVAIVTANLGTTGGGWGLGDVNGDNAIDNTDLSIVQSNLNFDRIDQYTPPGSGALPLTSFALLTDASTPEPSAVILAIFGLLGVAVRRPIYARSIDNSSF